MGILWDLLAGLVAVIGVVIGRIVGVALVTAIGFDLYLSIVLAIIGLIIAGAGFKRKGLGWAFVTGFGLGLATPVTTTVSNFLHIHF